MNLAFLMDPLESVIFEKDTTFVIMLEAYRRGHRVFFLPKGGISHESPGCFKFRGQEVIPQDDKNTPFLIKGPALLNDENLDGLMIRTDPPFDYDYLMHTWLLQQLPENITIINRPEGIRTANEKIWPMQFPDLIPPTLLSRDKGILSDFIQKHNSVIGKPTDGFGGQAVFRILADDSNKNVILETLTHGFTRDIILQPYVPEAGHGDKRILLLNGEPLGAVLRRHPPTDHRNNFFSGGQPHPADISDRDRHIIRTLKPHLFRLGLYFVGIDIIGDFLIEVNVTSPTCLQEMNRLGQVKLEKDILDFIERLIKNKPSHAPGQKE